jgi:hypothetical protein
MYLNYVRNTKPFAAKDQTRRIRLCQALVEQRTQRATQGNDVHTKKNLAGKLYYQNVYLIARNTFSQAVKTAKRDH